MSKDEFKGKSYIWAFPFLGVVIILSSFFYTLNPIFGKLILTFAFLIPFFIQVLTGYSLNHYWKLQYSRKNQAKYYYAFLGWSLTLPALVWIVF